MVLWASVRLGALKQPDWFFRASERAGIGFHGLHKTQGLPLSRPFQWACREPVQLALRDTCWKPALLSLEKGHLGSELGEAGFSLPGGPVGTAAPLPPPPLL